MDQAQFQLHAAIEDRHWWFVARRQILAQLASETLRSADDLVIDVGCGTGANLAAIAQGRRGVGIDTSPTAIELARERFAPQRYPHLAFRTGYAPDDVADVWPEARLVLLTDVLEHVPDDFALLGSLLDAARPGTWFLITVPAEEALWSPHDEAFGHYRRYDAARLRALFENQPLDVSLVSYYNSRLYPVIKSIRTINAWRGASSGADNTDFSLPSAVVNATLTRTFAGESKRLLGVIQGTRRPYRRGVSLVALVQRTEGSVAHRSRPATIAADLHDPAIYGASLSV